MSTESRARLKAQQIALLAALLRDGDIAEDFDRQRIEATSLSLIQKRERTIAKVWPSLAQDLGVSYSELFSQYASYHDIPAAGADADAKRFLQYLAKHDLIPDSLLLEFFCAQGWHQHQIWCTFIRRILKWNRMNCLMRSLCPMMRI